MKTCKKCNSSMFDIDINEKGLCPKCFKEEQLTKQKYEKNKEEINKQNQEDEDNCKKCGEKMKKLYVN